MLIADLHDAGLRAEHRGRPRRPARPRLRRVLRGRRLLLRAARAEFRLSFWICLPLAGILAAFAGILLGFPVLRLRGDYLAIVTLGFGEIIRLILLNWQSLTGGPNGITGIPRPIVFRPAVQFVRERICRDLRPAVFRDPPRGLSLLPDPGAGAADQLGDAAAAPPADRPRLGGAARGRNRLPRARHQHHDDQTHRVRHRRDVRRLRRRVLRHAAGLHQPGIFTFSGIGAGAGDRRARRHGLAAWRRARRDRDPRQLSNCCASSSSTACWCSARRWSRS